MSLGGDTDTLACITGGVAQAYYKDVPAFIREKVFAVLDSRLGAITRAFMERYCAG